MGLSIPTGDCRRCRLWRISRYSKMAMANSSLVFHRRRFSSSTCIRAQKRFHLAVVVALTDRSHRRDKPEIERPLGERP
jgi:hypothetical protein